MEFTFFCFNIKSVLQESLKDLVDMGDVFIDGPGEDKDVVQIHEHKPIEEISEDVIHQGLKHCGSVSESKRHNTVFISLPNSHQMVGVAGARKLNSGGGEGIAFDNCIVESSEINVGA